MLKAAVIGVGSMGMNHAQVYTELSDIHLVGITDTNRDTGRSIAERIGTHFYSNSLEMLEREKPDIVSIAVPTALHAELAVTAMENGAHILVEKPIAGTLEDAHKIIKKAFDLNRKLMVGHIVRYNPAVQILKQKINQGELGRIFQIACRRVGPFPSRIRDVGVVIDLAPHDLDLMRYIIGANPTRIFAETEKRIHTDHEDLLLGLLRFHDGATGVLEINWLTPTKVREVLVLGERGMYRVDDLTQDLYFYENAQVDSLTWHGLKNLKGVSEGSMTRFAIQRFEPLKAEIQAFINSVQKDEPVPISGEDGLIALDLALKLVESGLTHKVIKVDHDLK